MTEREELLEKFNASLEIMQKINDCEDQITALQNKRKKVRGVFRLLLLIVVLVSLAMLFEYIVQTCLPAIVYDFLAIGIILAYLFSFIAPFVLRSLLTKKCDKEIAVYQNTLTELKNNAVLSWLPMKYRDSVAYAYIMSYVDDMRANNLKEAINLFELECHQTRLEMNARYARR